MKQLTTLFSILLITLSCSNPDDEIECQLDDNLSLFDEFWTSFSQEYAAFEILDKDWDEIGDRYRPLINNNISEEALFHKFKSILFELEDAHSDLVTNTNLGSIQYYFEVTENAPDNYIGWQAMKDQYLENIVTRTNNLAFATVKETNIGYVRIRKFNDEPSKYNLVEMLLKAHENLDGIIVDIRDNDGGAEANAKQVASYFTDTNRMYRYARLKEGCERNTLTDFIELEFEPNENEKYLGKIVLLTNKKTFSAGEDFTLMMKTLPNVTQIGADTFGGFATGPEQKTLSNGWIYKISKKISYDLNQQPIIDGIPVDEVVTISDVDMQNNHDRILERAVEILE